MAVNKETYECDHGIREKGFRVNPLTHHDGVIFNSPL